MEFCQIELNYLDWTLQQAKEKCELLNRYSIPIWVMEPVRGGKLANLPAAAQEKPQIAEVIAVGPGGVVDGKEIKMEVKVGDQVIYSKYAGTDVKIDDEEYIIVKQSDILAVIQ